MNTTTSAIEQLAAVIAARKDSLSALRGRLADILDPIPMGVVLSDDDGEVCRIIRVCTGASQWSNHTWGVVIKGRAAIAMTGRLICESLDGSYHDGNNCHWRSTEPTCRYHDGEPGDALSFATGRDTRALAARLPAAIARYMEICKKEAELNATTLA